MASTPLQKHTLNLREGDVDYLAQVYAPKDIAVSLVIRRIVSQHVDGLKRKEGPANLDLGDIE